MNFHSRTASTRDDWMTPREIVLSLGQFDLDPCASLKDPNRLAARGFTIDDDGLSKSWRGRVWLNPPYGREAPTWVSRLAEHGNGIALIPPRMGAQWFHDTVLNRASAILFLRGRIAFLDPKTRKPVSGNNADSCLVAFGEVNSHALTSCHLAGAIWTIQHAE